MIRILCACNWPSFYAVESIDCCRSGVQSAISSQSDCTPLVDATLEWTVYRIMVGIMLQNADH